MPPAASYRSPPDVLPPPLQATITEALWFSGRIRLPEDLPDEAVKKFVAEVRVQGRGGSTTLQ